MGAGVQAVLDHYASNRALIDAGICHGQAREGTVDNLGDWLRFGCFLFNGSFLSYYRVLVMSQRPGSSATGN